MFWCLSLNSDGAGTGPDRAGADKACQAHRSFVRKTMSRKLLRIRNLATLRMNKQLQTSAGDLVTNQTSNAPRSLN